MENDIKNEEKQINMQTDKAIAIMHDILNVFKRYQATDEESADVLSAMLICYFKAPDGALKQRENKKKGNDLNVRK